MITWRMLCASLPKKRVDISPCVVLCSRLHLEICFFFVRFFSVFSSVIIRDEWDALAEPTALTSRIARQCWLVGSVGLLLTSSGAPFRREIFKLTVVVWKYLDRDWSHAEVCVRVATGWIAAQRGRQMRHWGGIGLRGQGRSRRRRWGGRCRRNCWGNVRQTTRIILGCSQRTFAKSRSAPSDYFRQ